MSATHEPSDRERTDTDSRGPSGPRPRTGVGSHGPRGANGEERHEDHSEHEHGARRRRQDERSGREQRAPGRCDSTCDPRMADLRGVHVSIDLLRGQTSR